MEDDDKRKHVLGTPSSVVLPFCHIYHRFWWLIWLVSRSFEALSSAFEFVFGLWRPLRPARPARQRRVAPFLVDFALFHFNFDRCCCDSGCPCCWQLNQRKSTRKRNMIGINLQQTRQTLLFSIHRRLLSSHSSHLSPLSSLLNFQFSFTTCRLYYFSSNRYENKLLRTANSEQRTERKEEIKQYGEDDLNLRWKAEKDVGLESLAVINLTIFQVFITLFYSFLHFDTLLLTMLGFFLHPFSPFQFI